MWKPIEKKITIRYESVWRILITNCELQWYNVAFWRRLHPWRKWNTLDTRGNLIERTRTEESFKGFHLVIACVLLDKLLKRSTEKSLWPVHHCRPLAITLPISLSMWWNNSNIFSPMPSTSSRNSFVWLRDKSICFIMRKVSIGRSDNMIFSMPG